MRWTTVGTRMVWIGLACLCFLCVVSLSRLLIISRAFVCHFSLSVWFGLKYKRIGNEGRYRCVLWKTNGTENTKHSTCLDYGSRHRGPKEAKGRTANVGTRNMESVNLIKSFSYCYPPTSQTRYSQRREEHVGLLCSLSWTRSKL